MDRGSVDCAHGRLMQDSVDVQPEDAAGGQSNHTKSANETSKLQTTVNFKPDSSVTVPNGSVERRRESRRCFFCILIAGILFLAAAGSIVLLLFRLHNRKIAVVKTRVGTIHGRLVASPEGPEVNEFLGIPFAMPPVGQLRYADPLRLELLPQDPYEATDFQNSCIQPIDETYPGFQGAEMWNARNPLSEDCLYMNIWTPKSNSTEEEEEEEDAKGEKKAILVWIYGGGFYSGTNALWVYDGKALAAFGDVVVVTFNYRVGSFGYLSTGDGRIKGNFGMKDQVMALRWIRDNIGSFGGDPSRVTIFGESSGASSAGLHQMSNESAHLFRRAIYQSGSPDSHWSFMSSALARQRAALFLERVDCRQQDPAALLGCLRALNATFIRDQEWVDDRFMAFPWAPTVDGEFLRDSPHEMLRRGEIQRKEALLGVNRDEGSYWIVYALNHFSKDNDSLQTHDMYSDGVDRIAWDVPDKDRQVIKAKYLKYGGSDWAANRDSLDKVCGDRSFTCPTEELTEIFSRNEITTYFYYLTYRASVEVWPQWMGVIHGADVQWVFGMPLNASRNYKKDEVEFSKVIMTYWSNFAKTGDPNSDKVPPWPEYRHNEKRFLEFRHPLNFTVFEKFRGEYCDVWRRVNREIHEKKTTR